MMRACSGMLASADTLNISGMELKRIFPQSRIKANETDSWSFWLREEGKPTFLGFCSWNQRARFTENMYLPMKMVFLYFPYSSFWESFEQLVPGKSFEHFFEKWRLVLCNVLSGFELLCHLRLLWRGKKTFKRLQRGTVWCVWVSVCMWGCRC